MENRIPIDDLFKDGLSQGKEQLNLGAWANMERMLDGKNPYSEEEPKRKRRFLPLFGILALLTTLLSAGYLMQKAKSSKKVSNVEVVHENVTPNTISGNSTDNSNTAPVASNEKNNTNQDIQINNNSTTTNSTINSVSTNTSNSKRVNQDNTNNEINKSQNDAKVVESKATSNNIIAINSESSYSKTDANSHLESQTSSEPHGKKMSKRAKKLAQTKLEKENLNNESMPIHNQASITKNKIELQTIKQLELQQNISLNRNGEVTSITFDTIAQTTREIEKLSAVNNLKNTPNPRFVELTPEQELAANKKIELEKIVTSEKNTEPILHVSNKENSNLSIANSKSKNSKSEGIFKNAQDLAKSSYEKISLASMKLFHMNLPMYTGFTAGVNASLFGTKHNFGGFQGGFTNMIPLSEYYSIMSELKIFYRNNSGYTVNDITTNVLNPIIDPVTNAAQNQTIYSYQLDSTNRIYNFKHIISLELPIMMQRHLNNFTVYGGLNFAYNFKLNTNQIVRNYVINKADTVDNSFAYSFQAEKGQNYVKQDFSSRFGIGYAVGASYSFNPNLYLDFRLSQNVWDNTKTNSAREISKGFFKVPSIQFSLGYRFKKFERD